MNHFSTRLSPLIKGYNLLVFGVLAALGLFNLARGNLSAAIPLLSIFLALFLVGFLAVRGYDVGDGQLVIHRPAWDTFIDLGDLNEARTAPKLVWSSFSLWSTRGLFGFIGYGYASEIGSYRAYITDPSKAVMLRFSSGKVVVVSPESPTEFIASVTAQSKGLRRAQEF